jgi:TonB family protein
MANLSGLAMPILVSAALKSTFVLGAAWLGALALRGRSAAARHLVWTAAAAALLALPLFSVALQALPVGRAGAILPVNLGLLFHATGTAAAAEGAGAVAAVSSSPGTSKPAAGAPAPRLDWKTWLLWLWAAGVAISFARMLAACAAMWRLRRKAAPYPEPERARALAAALGIRHEVEVLETARGSMPMTFGLLRPAIFMPCDAGSWTGPKRQMVLLHELAHVRRGDVATHLMARVALSLYWWNPLAWTAWREFLKERERAADDLVLNSGAGAAEYAGHLLEVARTMHSAPATAWAALAMARPSQLEGRLVAILDSRRNRQQPGRLAAAAAALLAIAVVAPVAALQSQEASPASPPPARANVAFASVAGTVQSQDEQAVAPEVEATIRAANNQKNHEMLEQAASAFEKLRKYSEAQKLREAALAIRGQVSGPQSLDYAVGLIQLGDLARKRGKWADAEADYAKAVAAVGDRAETASALLSLSMGAYRTHDFDKAMEYAQRARNVSPAGPQMGKAMTWIGQIREKQEGGAADAEALYTGALSQEDANSADAALTTEVYARFLRGQDRTSEAEIMETRAANVRKSLIAAGSPNVGLRMAAAYKVGNGTTAPKLLHKLEPEYTEEARAGKIAGTVLLSIVIEPDGTATNFQIVKGMGFGLDEKAVEAIGQWRFSPGAKDGVPVPVKANIEVNFRLM